MRGLENKASLDNNTIGKRCLKMKIGKGIIFILFCFISAAFLACSDDFITTVSHTDNIEVSPHLAKVNTFSVHRRYRDSVFLASVGEWSTYYEELIAEGLEDEIEFPKFKNPELDPSRPDFLDDTEAYIKEFYLSWSDVHGAKGYEVRVNKKPITPINWSHSEKVMLVSTYKNNGIIEAKATITPTPKTYTSRCIDCGACYQKCPTGAITSKDKRAFIDYSKCIECGECYRACEYDAIGGVFAGTAYYFAIRAYDEDSAFSKEIQCTNERSKIRYTSLAEIPDSMNIEDPEKQIAIKFGSGCGGNCSDGTAGETTGSFNTCFIIQHDACPVNAVYQVAKEDIKDKNTHQTAMFIDHDKCVNCGECALACSKHGPWGAIVTEVIAVD